MAIEYINDLVYIKNIATSPPALSSAGMFTSVKMLLDNVVDIYKMKRNDELKTNTLNLEKANYNTDYRDLMKSL